MKIEKFWIVTEATKRSIVADVCFEADMPGLALQFLGGLQPHEIVGVYTEEDEAKEKAKSLLWMIVRGKERNAMLGDA